MNSVFKNIKDSFLLEKELKKAVSEIGDNRVSELFSKFPNGKMVRGKLVLEIAGEKKEAIKLASIIELIHAASLLHDDVIDNSDTRRGKKSINSLYGNKSAIMLGDILYSKSFIELNSFNKEIVLAVSRSVNFLSIGELMDVELSKNFNSSEELYFDMIYKKTAVLIEGACISSALLIGEDEKKFGIYGRNLGLVFQIIDDILDITSTSEKLGKPVFQDFQDGKTTLPYIYLYEQLEKEDKKKLVSLHGKKLSIEEQNWLTTEMKNSKVLDRCYNKAREYSKEGIEAIFNVSNNEGLILAMEKMVDRDK